MGIKQVLFCLWRQPAEEEDEEIQMDREGWLELRFKGCHAVKIPQKCPQQMNNSKEVVPENCSLKIICFDSEFTGQEEEPLNQYQFLLTGFFNPITVY